MKPLNALSLAPAAREWLANSHHPRILHVFEQACNLIDERGDVLSIVTPQIGNGPFNLVLEEEVLFSDHLDVQSSISTHADRLHLGDLTIDTAIAKLWQPRPDWETLHARRVDILNQIMSLRALPGAKQSPNEEKIASSQRALLAMTPIPDSLISALISADLPSSLIAARKLAGLGIGLTPTGDDFIMGAVYAAWIIHPPENASLFAREITNTAAPLTTSLSAAWLRSAGKGETGITWHDLFDALISGNFTRKQESVKKILAVGETSGADALAGFIGTFTHWGEARAS